MLPGDGGASALLGTIVAVGLLGVFAVSVVSFVQNIEPERVLVEGSNLDDLADSALQRLITTTGEPPAWTAVTSATALGLLDDRGARNLGDSDKVRALQGATEAQLRQKLGLPPNVAINVSITMRPLPAGFSSTDQPWFVGSSSGSEAQWLRTLMEGYRGWNASESDAASPEAGALAQALYRTVFDTVPDTGSALSLEQALTWAAGFDAYGSDSTDAEATAGNGLHWRLYSAAAYPGVPSATEVFLAVSFPTDPSGPGTPQDASPNQWALPHILVGDNRTASLYLSGIDLGGLTDVRLTLDHWVRAHQENPNYDYRATAYARPQGASGAWTHLWSTHDRSNNWQTDVVTIPPSLQNQTLDFSFTFSALCTIASGGLTPPSCSNIAEGWWIRGVEVSGTRDGQTVTVHDWDGDVVRQPPSLVVGSGTNTAGWNETTSIKYALDLLVDKGLRVLVMGQDVGEQPDWLWALGQGQYPLATPLTYGSVDHLLFQHPQPIDPFTLGAPAGYAYTGAGDAPVRDANGRGVILWDSASGVLTTAYRPGTAGGQDLLENLLAASLAKIETVNAGTHPPEGTQMAVVRAGLGIGSDAATSMPGLATVTVKLWWIAPT